MNPGTLAAFKRVIATLLSMTQTRLELAGIELAEEKNRLLNHLFMGLAAILFFSFAVLILTLLLVAHFWETHRLAAMLSIAAAYAAVGAVFWARLKKMVAAAPPPLAATLAELGKDRDALMASAEQELRNEHP